MDSRYEPSREEENFKLDPALTNSSKRVVSGLELGLF